jgi:adenylate kinase family enzyme
VRVHILGASGAGTSTLGGALAAAVGTATHLDTDDYFWEPTDPPFERARPPETRLSLLSADLDSQRSWVLSGCLCGWGDPLIPRFELVVFMWATEAVRLARLRAREREQFGADALAPGGAMHENHEAFIAWAASYDDGDLSMRSRARHEAWLSLLPCRVVRLEAVAPVAEQVAAVLLECGAH